jgi:hypothetical protein
MEQTWVIVGNFENEIDAEIAKGHLKSEGIDSKIVKNDGGGMFPSLQQTEGVLLVVAEAEKQKAREILEARRTKR